MAFLPSTVPGHSPTPFQDTRTPDINLERDVVALEAEEALLGSEIAELANVPRFRINIVTILISAFLFLAVLAWFDFIQGAFTQWLQPQSEALLPATKLWYAILTSFLVLGLVAILANSMQK